MHGPGNGLSAGKEGWGGGGEGEVRGKGRLGGRESVLHRHLHLVRLEELS